MLLFSPVTIAVALCVISAVAYAVGALLQQRVAYLPLRVMVRTPGWWLAVGSNGVGAVLHIVALRYGPLVLVQALGVLTLVVAVPLAAAVDRRQVGRAEGSATALSTVGLVGLMALTGSSAGTALTGRDLVVLLLVTAAALTLLSARRGVVYGSGLAAAAAGGIAFGAASALTQTITVHIGAHGLAAMTSPIVVVAVLAYVGLEVAGVLFTQRSYRHGLAAPLAVGTVANPVAAAAIGIVLLDERFRAGGLGILLAVFCAVCTTVGIWLLAAARTSAGVPSARTAPTARSARWAFAASPVTPSQMRYTDRADGPSAAASAGSAAAASPPSTAQIRCRRRQTATAAPLSHRRPFLRPRSPQRRSAGAAGSAIRVVDAHWAPDATRVGPHQSLDIAFPRHLTQQRDEARRPVTNQPGAARNPGAARPRTAA